MHKQGFRGRLEVTPHEISGDWKLLNEFIYVSKNGNKITVPAGFVTDFASVPKPLRAVFESWGAYGYASVFHDWLCREKTYQHFIGSFEAGNKGYMPANATRAQADKLFYEIMEYSGVSTATRVLLYVGVRIGAAFNFITFRGK